MVKYVIKNIERTICIDKGRDPRIIAEVGFQDELGKSFFITAEIEDNDRPTKVYKTPKSVYQKFVNNGAATEDAICYLSDEDMATISQVFYHNMSTNHLIYSWDGSKDFFVNKECGGDLHDVIHFVFFVALISIEKAPYLDQEYVGKAIGDFEIPELGD